MGAFTDSALQPMLLEKDEELQGLMEALRAFSKKEKELYGWQVALKLHRSDQRLLSAQDNFLRAVTVRENIFDKSLSVKVYSRYDDPTVQGSASLIIDQQISFENQIREAFVNSLNNRSNSTSVLDLIGASTLTKASSSAKA